jgi:hypothetical protein
MACEEPGTARIVADGDRMRASPTLAAPETAPDRLRLPGRRLVLACLFGLPLLSVIVLREPSYDPTAWLIWGRQIAHGTLETAGGPSWKPLPVLFTTLFAPTGSHVAPVLWLLIARAGALAAILAAFQLARRLSGGSAVSGLVAGGALLLASDFLYNAVRGDSEGLLVAAVLGAALLHCDRREHAAFALGGVAALLRPEVWPLWAAYGALVLHRHRDVRTLALLAGSAVVVLAAWFVPEEIGSGNLLRSGDRARNPVPGSPGSSDLPFLMTFVNGAAMLSIPVYAGAVFAVVRAWRERDGTLLAIAAGATVLMVIVAILAQNGFTGNLRYVTLPASVLCVLAGIGLPPLARRLRGGRGWWAAVAVTAISVAVGIGVVGWGGYRLVRDEHRYGHDLPALIEARGGAAAIRACGPVWASPFERQSVAWRLRLAQKDVSTRWSVATRGTVIAYATSRVARRSPLPLRDRLGPWILRSECP